MKNQLLFTAIIVAFLGHLASYAQETTGEVKTVQIDSVDQKKTEWAQKIEKEVKALEDQKKKYESLIREQLMQDIKKINNRMASDAAYTENMATIDKKKVAEESAERIKKHNAMVDSQIAFAQVKTYNDDREATFGFVWKDEGGFSFDFGDEDEKLRFDQPRTTSTASLALGYNYMAGDNLSIDDFSYPNNNFFSFGVLWQTAITKNRKLRFNYGVAYQTQGTELNGDRAFSINTDNTQIVDLGFEPRKAKFRQDQFVFPLQLEFGNTTKKEYEDGRVRYEQWDKWKFGVGGFVGFNMSSRLKTKFEENGRDVKQITINAFENETFLYGLDAYVGYNEVTFFGRMNLNKVFKDQSVDAQYVTFGIRLQ
jgi:hypothetical protein